MADPLTMIRLGEHMEGMMPSCGRLLEKRACGTIIRMPYVAGTSLSLQRNSGTWLEHGQAIFLGVDQQIKYADRCHPGCWSSCWTAQRCKEETWMVGRDGMT